jgi:hypothetical protein
MSLGEIGWVRHVRSRPGTEAEARRRAGSIIVHSAPACTLALPVRIECASEQEGILNEEADIP